MTRVAETEGEGLEKPPSQWGGDQEGQLASAGLSGFSNTAFFNHNKLNIRKAEHI